MKNFLSLAVSRDVSQLIMRVDKPTSAYKFIIFPPPPLPPHLLDIFSIHKYIDLISTLDRPHIDPTLTPYRPYIDPTSTPHRPFIDVDPRLNLFLFSTQLRE